MFFVLSDYTEYFISTTNEIIGPRNQTNCITIIILKYGCTYMPNIMSYTSMKVGNISMTAVGKVPTFQIFQQQALLFTYCYREGSNMYVLDNIQQSSGININKILQQKQL